MPGLADLRIDIFADGADLPGMLEMYELPFIAGFTTNPTLMRSAGVCDYVTFSQDLLRAIPDRPISLETFADDFSEMERQAHEIASWGDNVYVKIPVTNTFGESSVALLHRLSAAGMNLNVTAVMSPAQVRAVVPALEAAPSAYVSLFAGRIADTGRDPVPIAAEALRELSGSGNLQLLWASCRELFNVFQADAVGCHAVTVTNDLLRKASLVGRDLDVFSLDTVKMFHNDAQKAGYSLDISMKTGG